jgi:class 3 adenylate cyclase
MEANVCLPGQIVVSRSTVEQLEGSVPTRLLGSFQLRGRHSRIEVYEVI